MTQPQIITAILHSLASVTKSNLRQAVANSPEYSQFSPRSWQILINEVYTRESLNFCKLYKEPDGNIIAVFINQKQPSGSVLCYSLIGEHSHATPEYLRTRCTRIKPDAPEAQNLVKFLLGNYAQRYHTEKPILI